MFIVFEGIDGSGKTTLSRLLFETFTRKGIKTVLTREPFDETLRQVVLAGKLDPWGETFIFLGDRNLHVNGFIEPYLRKKYAVISDRYYLSTLAYQGFGRGLDLKLLEDLNKKATRGLEPDITFLLDLDVDTAMERIKKTRKSFEKFEDKEFLQKVRMGFLKLAENKNNVVILDGKKNIYQLLGEVLIHIDNLFRKKIL